MFFSRLNKKHCNRLLHVWTGAFLKHQKTWSDTQI